LLLRNSLSNTDQNRFTHKKLVDLAPVSSGEELELLKLVKEMSAEFHVTPGSLKCTRAILTHQDVYKFDDGEINLKSVHGQQELDNNLGMH